MTLRNQGAQNLSMAELYEDSAKAGVRFSQPKEVVFPSAVFVSVALIFFNLDLENSVSPDSPLVVSAKLSLERTLQNSQGSPLQLILLTDSSSLMGVAKMAEGLLSHHSQAVPKVSLVFLDIEKGRIHLSNDPLTFYWSSHEDQELTFYCSNTEFILQQQFLLEQQGSP